MLRRLPIAMCLLTCFSNAAPAAEQAVTSRVESVSLFKNGLSVVKRSVSVPGPGTYRVDDMINPVHGTYRVESDAAVTSTSTWREVAVQLGNKTSGDFRQELAGRQVTVYLQDAGTRPISGKVTVPESKTGDDAWNRDFQIPNPYWNRYGGSNDMASPASRFLVLDTPEGRSYIDFNRIAEIKTDRNDDSIQRRQPVLLLTVGDKHDSTRPITISYLARGLSWAPSYCLDIQNGHSLSIEQQAVVKNELESFEQAEMFLISGFPSVQMQHVISPLSLKTNWAAFFQQLNTPENPSSGFAGNSAMTQNSVNGISRDFEGDLSATTAGEGIDLHFQPIGRHTLAEGDALAFSTAKAQAEYERVIEWIVPDDRGTNGVYLDWNNQRDAEKYQDQAWDCVRFKNPFQFPMTTAPAMVTTKGVFSGQCAAHWVNPGEQTSIRVTKSLSIRTKATEFEQANDVHGRTNEGAAYFAGHAYHRIRVQGELTANNHRNEEVKMLVRRQFSGELVRADEKPKVVLREEGAKSVNPRSELSWTVHLKPGEEKKLTYEYLVLVW